MHRTVTALAAAAVLLIAGCGDDPSDETESSTADAGASSPSSPSPGERRGGTLTLASGESVSYWCAGQGGPGVLLEAGTDSGGTDAWPAAFVDPLIAQTTVCTYDRPGTGDSDPPPHRRRAMPDLCAVQDQVIAKSPLRQAVRARRPVGGRQPQHRLRGPAPRSRGRPGDHRQLPRRPRGHCGRRVSCGPTTRSSWTTSTTPRSSARWPRRSAKFPVLVVSATEADPGGEKNQRYWLQLSPHSRQVRSTARTTLQEVAPRAGRR